MLNWTVWNRSFTFNCVNKKNVLMLNWIVYMYKNRFSIKQATMVDMP